MRDQAAVGAEDLQGQSWTGHVAPSSVRSFFSALGAFGKAFFKGPQSEAFEASDVDSLGLQVDPRSSALSAVDEEAAISLQSRKAASRSRRPLRMLLILLLLVAAVSSGYTLARGKWGEVPLASPPAALGEEAVATPPPVEAPLPPPVAPEPSEEKIHLMQQPEPEKVQKELEQSASAPWAAVGEAEEEKKPELRERGIPAGEAEEKAEGKEPKPDEAGAAAAVEGEEKEEEQPKPGEEVAARTLPGAPKKGIAGVFKKMFGRASIRKFRKKGKALKAKWDKAGSVAAGEAEEEEEEKEPKPGEAGAAAAGEGEEEQPKPRKAVAASTLPSDQERMIIDVFKGMFVDAPPGSSLLRFLKGGNSLKQFMLFLYRFEKDLEGEEEQGEEQRRRRRLWTLFKMQMATLANMEATAAHTLSQLSPSQDKQAWQQASRSVEEIYLRRIEMAGLWAQLADEVGVHPNPEIDEEVFSLMEIQEEHYSQALNRLLNRYHGLDDDKPFKENTYEDDPRFRWRVLWSARLPAEDSQEDGWMRFVIP
ncbi:hypothetical protein Esti_002233 [Eimeria stiedai]